LKAKTFILLMLLPLIGCTSIEVQRPDPSLGIRHVCIQENPKVKVDDFVSVLQQGFDRHGLSTEVFSGPPPPNCEYILTYTALRSWDMAPYLSHAELRLEKDGRQVGHAVYHLRGKGGLSPAKWQGTKEKMDPVIDELLKK
jgi:hypothetical protein